MKDRDKEFRLLKAMCEVPSLVVKAQFNGHWFLFGPWVEAERTQYVKEFIERLEDAWPNPQAEVLEINSPNEALGMAKSF